MSIEDTTREKFEQGAEIIDKRNKFVSNSHSGVASGANSLWFIELIGGKMILYTAFEPDPNTHRDDYYYNVVDNVLYKKIKINGVYAWKRISN